jgi:hypothetical protein
MPALRLVLGYCSGSHKFQADLLSLQTPVRGPQSAKQKPLSQEEVQAFKDVFAMFVRFLPAGLSVKLLMIIGRTKMAVVCSDLDFVVKELVPCSTVSNVIADVGLRYRHHHCK